MRIALFYGVFFAANGIIMQAASNYINQAMDSAFSFAGPLAQPSGRESNVASYNSPTLGGFNASLSYGPGASEGSAYTGTGQSKEQLYVVTGRYSGGPIRGWENGLARWRRRSLIRIAIRERRYAS